MQVGSSHISNINASNSVTVSSVYNGPISSGQVSVLTNTSGSNNVMMQTIPVGSGNINQVSINDSSHNHNGNLLGSGKVMFLILKHDQYSYLKLRRNIFFIGFFTYLSVF